MDEKKTYEVDPETGEAKPQVQLGFFEQAKIYADRVLDKIYKLRCICCFTSLFACLGFVFLFAEVFSPPAFVQWIIVALWLFGVVSGVVACPVKMIANAFGLIAGGTVIGLPFLGIGAVFGFAIGAIIAFGMIFFLPAIVTIPYYRNELQFKNILK